MRDEVRIEKGEVSYQGQQQQGDEKDANFLMEWKRFLFAAVVQHSEQMRSTGRGEPCSAVW